MKRIVDAYIRDWRELAAGELRYYKSQGSLHGVIATMCEQRNGKRHSHQRRIPSSSIEEARRRLSSTDLERARSFDELHAAIEKAIGDIHKIGDLAVYDIAHRLGAVLDLEPDLVYLHCGSLKGARALGLRGKALGMWELPPEFSELAPYEAEDVLCLYANELVGAARGESRCFARASGGC